MLQETKKGYKKLKVWEEAHNLVKHVYKIIGSFPKSETFGLTSQLKRAIISVPANIVEGHVKQSRKEFLHHLEFARGSLAESEYYFQLAFDLRYLTKEQFTKVEDQRSLVGNLLFGLIKSIRSETCFKT